MANEIRKLHEEILSLSKIIELLGSDVRDLKLNSSVGASDIYSKHADSTMWSAVVKSNLRKTCKDPESMMSKTEAIRMDSMPGRTPVSTACKKIRRTETTNSCKAQNGEWSVVKSSHTTSNVKLTL